MTKDARAKIATVIVLAGALGLVFARRMDWNPASAIQVASPPSPAQEPQPQDTIYRMLDAARAGDVNTYLDCYSGQLAVALRQSLAESTSESFARYLRDSNAAIKGVAVNEPQALTSLEVKARVEYVYTDRNEAQFLYLQQGPGGWKIVRADGSERVKTLVPYGTPAQ